MAGQRPGYGLGQGAVAVAAVAVVVAACGTGSAPPRNTAPSVQASRSVTPARTTPKPVPYDLYTHCGIDYARVGNRYYEAVLPLSDGSGNPPPGWGNPYQPGTMTLVSPDEAVFTDKAGHRVVFRLAPPGPAKKTVRVCA